MLTRPRAKRGGAAAAPGSQPLTSPTLVYPDLTRERAAPPRPLLPQPTQAQSSELRARFEPYGKIGDVFIPRDRASGKGRGFGFVRFFEQADAEAAVAGENNKDFMGRAITCEVAKYARPEVRGAGAAARWGPRGAALVATGEGSEGVGPPPPALCVAHRTP